MNSIARGTAPLLLVLAAACRGDAAPDAYGNFEATEVVVAAQMAGPITEFTVTEGARVERGAITVTIDTTAFVLERQQLTAQRAAVVSRRAELTEQVHVLDVQREIAARVYERTRRLHDQQAATTQQLDQAERDHRTLLAQLDGVRASQRSVGLEADAVEARVAQARDRVSRATVINPITGTVLATYARQGEVVGAGQPLYKVAALDTLELRAYVSGAQLASVKLGQVVDVTIDRDARELLTVKGTVSWVASQGEFTPTPVQTRDERTDLVYAIKVRVPNPDGVLKIGMPADVSLAGGNAPVAP
jgi:HlyD family secretion protein